MTHTPEEIAAELVRIIEARQIAAMVTSPKQVPAAALAIAGHNEVLANFVGEHWPVIVGHLQKDHRDEA